jgi:uncharacterized membrane protein HdeD (DUF308 family)
MKSVTTAMHPRYAFDEPVTRHWLMHLGMGILAIVLGVVGLGYAGTVTLAGVIFFGWLLVIGGIARLVHAFYTRHWQGVVLNVLVGLLWLAVGAMTVLKPGIGAVSLTFALVIMFFVSGVLKIAVAATLQFPQWGWTVVDGVVSLILAILILASWPLSSMWVIGMLISIDLIFAGWAIVAVAIAARRLESEGALA